MAMTEPGPNPADPTRPVCVVTYGRSNYLGRSIAAALVASGHWSTVRVVDPFLPPPPSPPPPALVHFQADFSDWAHLLSALTGVAAVFHVDPTAGGGSPEKGFALLHDELVRVTRNLLVACGESGVRRLVYTGSADVVFDGRRDVIDADESAPYPDEFGDVLNELRAQVEMMVLSADGRDGMRTCALRPSNPFGAGDSNLVTFIAGYAKSPFPKFVVGSGYNLCDFTYVENVAHSNICAEQALCTNSACVAGKPFFVTNDQPIEMWEFISSLLEGMGYQRPTINLPAKILLLAAVFSKVVHERLGFQVFSSPLLGPAVIYSLSRTRTFNTSKAKRLLQYSPSISLEDGLMRTIESFPAPSNILGSSRKQDFRGPSKADTLLGSGVAADILLWRDEKRTFTYITISFLLFYWFLLSNRTFISSAAKILLIISVTLLVHGFLPSSIFGFPIEKVTSACFEVSQSTLRSSFMSLASIWNRGIHVLRLLAKGDDWNILFKAVASLCFLKLMFYFPLKILIGLGLAFMFIVFIVYEQCEEEVDRLIATASVKINSSKDRILENLPASLKVYISQS